MTLAFAFGEIDARLWSHIPIEDPRLSELADRHYSRQTTGAKGVIGPGWRFVLWHEGPSGSAGWGVVRGRFRGEWRWRNSFFRNESGTLSSALIIAATRETFEMWERRYKALPPEQLTTEIGIEETIRRRSRRNPPGHCYAMAGWELVRFTQRGHGRTAKAIYAAIKSIPEIFWPRHWLVIGQWMLVERDLERRLEA